MNHTKEKGCLIYFAKKCHSNGQQTEACSDLAIKHIIALYAKDVIIFDKPN